MGERTYPVVAPTELAHYLFEHGDRKAVLVYDENGNEYGIYEWYVMDDFVCLSIEKHEGVTWE